MQNNSQEHVIVILSVPVLCDCLTLM